MAKKVIVNIFPRNRYLAAAVAKTHTPRERKKLASMLGGADAVYLQTRVYSRDANVTLNFTILHSSFGDEQPAEGPRPFTLANTGATPALPYDATSMPTLPDDGQFSVSPKMGLVDVQAVAGGASGSVEFETWATLIYTS